MATAAAAATAPAGPGGIAVDLLLVLPVARRAGFARRAGCARLLSQSGARLTAARWTAPAPRGLARTPGGGPLLVRLWLVFLVGSRGRRLRGLDGQRVGRAQR